MSLYNILKSNIDTSINNYIEIIAKKYSLNSEELWDIWNNNEFEENEFKKEKSEKRRGKKNIIPEPRNLCNYVLKRGVNAGKPCGKPCMVNKPFCSRHKNTSSLSSPSKLSSPNYHLVLNKDIDMYWHPNTRLIFEKTENKYIVTSKLNINNQVENLEPEDIKICEKYSFRYKELEEERDDISELIDNLVIKEDNDKDITKDNDKEDIADVLYDIKENISFE